MNNSSTSNINNRLTKLRNILKEKEMDGVLITKRENYSYLSGFTGTSAYLVITENDAVLVTDFRYKEQATAQAPQYKVIQYEGSLLEELQNVLKNLNIRKLGLEDGAVSYSSYMEYQSSFKEQELLPLGNSIEHLRLIKDSDEIRVIKKAIEIADKAFDYIVGVIKPGMKETEVAAEMEYFMKKNGALGPSFETIVASGYRAALPHGVASEKVIENGEVVVMDYGCIYDGYCSDITRTVFIGHKNEEMAKIYNIVLDAQKKAEENIKAGITGIEADAFARDLINSAGYKGKFGHGLGHGLGKQIHEDPRLSPKGNGVLLAGSVATVEPGIYLEGIGGVRIEDVVVIKEGGIDILTAASKELFVL